MRAYLAILFSALSISAALGAQEVILPLDRYQDLRERAHEEDEPEPEPPVPVALEEAVLTVDVGPTSAKISQELRLELYAEGWQEVPLPKLGTFIEADFGTLEGRIENSTLHVRGSGRHRLTLVSVAEVERDESARRPTWRLGLEAPRAALVHGVLRHPSEVEDVDGEGQVLLDPAPDRTWVAEPGAGFGFILRGAARRPERELLPLRFDAVSAAIIEISRRRLHVATTVEIAVLQGELDEARLTLPEGFEVIGVDGPVAGWDVEPDTLVITPLRAVQDRLAFTVELTAAPAEKLKSPLVGVAGASRVLTAVKVRAADDGFLHLLDAGGARRADLREEARLPRLYREAPGLPLVVPPAAAPPRWQVVWSEAAEVLAAQVDLLVVDAIVGADGRAAVQLWAEVRSSGAPRLELRLTGAELITAERDGIPLEPGRTASGWALPLHSTTEAQVFHLALLLPFVLPASGRADLLLPSFSAPVARVDAKVHLPGDRRYELAEPHRSSLLKVPPRAANRDDLPLVARQLDLASTAGRTVVSWLFVPPSSHRSLSDAWSAMTPSPAPLGILVKNDSARREWF